jgi:hypothetical protein
MRALSSGLPDDTVKRGNGSVLGPDDVGFVRGGELRQCARAESAGVIGTECPRP